MIKDSLEGLELPDLPKRHRFNMNRIEKIEAKIEEAGEESLSRWEKRYYLEHCDRVYYNHLAECYATGDLGI